MLLLSRTSMVLKTWKDWQIVGWWTVMRRNTKRYTKTSMLCKKVKVQLKVYTQARTQARTHALIHKHAAGPTDRQTDIPESLKSFWTRGSIDRQTDRQTDRQRTQFPSDICRQVDRQTDRQTYDTVPMQHLQIVRQRKQFLSDICRQTHRQKDRQTDWQTDRPDRR